ncbi:uncharacterized protein TRAVEDRAFT_122880 [Trametes versicolor FP-101664 SS1]|uniref:uncharacterized protein n=1 Tax=Trametes versicolor (strain FP-101664) TaxID=717944 RepID=UPI00046213FD|nr:uncharacterized protein TRAVEDRAFT_122880 [Trametes versicolor FP-101664 SS1]EIW59836.1 hypothetical protein TRAVEDRAFT_122880 [Trametes versicolor FP-101664 SS1]
MFTTSQCSITEAEKPVLIAQKNGFVHSILQAYAAHHHLVIRPDDVWIAILTQLSFYVNAHAEKLRQYFVAHQGKRTLEVSDVGFRTTVDFGSLARAMTGEIHKNVVDRTLVDWILPDFTTTSLKDTTICSVIMMSTLQKYYNFYMVPGCGIPTVTLEGTKADWLRILKRLERLYELGDEPSAWANMLYPILSRFVSAFDGKPDTEFWKHVVCSHSPICGPGGPDRLIDGWLTAFCVWTNEGKWVAGPLAPRLAIPRPPPIVVGPGPSSRSGDRAPLYESHDTSYTLDGIRYFTVDIARIPVGYCEVDVTVIYGRQSFPCLMLAGHVASVARAKVPGGPLNTLALAPQWFIMEKRS